MKKHNFSAGPCILPQEVFEKASKAVLELEGTGGLSLIEISHRSKEFVAIMEKAVALTKKLAGLSDDYEVLFLQGGASLQFVNVAYNLMKEGGKAAYIDSGSWSAKAIKEAKKFGEVEVVGSSKEQGYNFIPKDISVSKGTDYLHLTSNNTISGTQFKEFPNVDVPLVADMSSDIFSRKLDFSKFDLIYAGAQKNLGPAGVAIVMVKKDILGKSGRDIPSYLDYSIHASKDSMFNTPPVFAVYTTMLTLEWLDNLGGLEAIEKLNNEKAELLYNEIDRNSLFTGVAAKEDRSTMNVTFTIKEELKEKFDALWKSSDINNLNGHRSVGGYRASIYNAMPKESIQYLVELMQNFEKENA